MAFSSGLNTGPMDLLTFISDPERKRRLAALTGSSEGYLWQCATGWRNKKPSPVLARKIQLASVEIGVALGCEPLALAAIRPDIWPAETA